MKKRLLSALLALCIVLTLLPGTAFAADIVASGYCGDDSNGGNGENLTWLLTADGVLTISGSGEMKNYVGYSWGLAPWCDYRTSISQVRIGSEVTSIGDYAFSFCKNLTSIVIPNNITNIGSSAFDNCESLTSIIIPDSVVSIGDWAFAHCTGLTNITIPDNVTNIGHDAFAFCTSLTNITLPDNIKSIEVSVFEECTSLAKITIPGSVVSIGASAFKGCTSLLSIAIPDNVTSIGSHAFYGCRSLANMVIPDGVTSIEEWTFAWCTNLVSIAIPSSVTIIEEYAFYQDVLEDVYYSGTEAEWNRIVHRDSPAYMRIHYSLTPAPGSTITPDAAYNHFGKLDRYDYNGSAVIDGVTYQFAEEYKNSSSSIGPIWAGDYTDNYIYALYNLNAANEITALKYDRGVLCKLEGWDAANSIVDTDLAPIAGPNGFELGLKSGDYRVSDIVKGSFPTSQIANWVGDDIRIYTDGQTIYKVIHVEHRSGTITAFKNGSAVVDEILYSVALGDNQLIKDINENLSHYVKFTTYDNTIVELTAENLFVDYQVKLTVDSLKIKIILNGSYEFGDGGLLLCNYEDDSVAYAFFKHDFWKSNYKDEQGLPRTEILLAVGQTDFGLGKKYYLKVNDSFMTNSQTGTSLADYFPSKEETYMRTTADVWSISNQDAGTEIDKSVYTDMFGSIEGTILYNRMHEVSKDGLCAGFVISAESFYLGKVAPYEFFQSPLAYNIWDIQKSSKLNETNFDADMYIQRAFLLQWLPEAQEQLVGHVNNTKGLYEAVRQYRDTGKGCVYVRLGSKETGHAVWAYDIEEYAGYCLIYVYDCNAPTETRTIKLAGNYPNFTLFEYQYDDFNWTNISFFSDLDYIAGYARRSNINLPYHILSSDSSKFSVMTPNQETASYQNSTVSGATGVIIPITFSDTGASSETGGIYWISDSAILELDKTSQNGQGISFASKTNAISVSETSYDKLVIDTSSQENEMLVTLYANNKTEVNTTYTWLIDDEIVDVAIMGSASDQYILHGYEDSVSLIGVTNPTIKVTIGDKALNKTVEVNEGEIITISLQERDGNLEIDANVESNPADTYTITLNASPAEGGTVTVTPTSAKSGDKVIITAKPNISYTTDSVTVTNSNGNSVSVTDNGDGTYAFTMAASQVTVSATFVPVETPWVNPFTDVQPSAYYYDAVAWAVENGITYGITDITFGPDMACTRAQIVSFLWRAVGSPKMSGTNPFTDVTATDYYYDAVLWAVENGVTAGITSTTFGPNEPCTRAQAVSFLYRAKNSPVVSGTSSFMDLASGAYYVDAVQWAVNTGVTAGTSDTTFSPEQICTRAQIVSFLYRDRAN